MLEGKFGGACVHGISKSTKYFAYEAVDACFAKHRFGGVEAVSSGGVDDPGFFELVPPLDGVHGRKGGIGAMSVTELPRGPTAQMCNKREGTVRKREEKRRKRCLRDDRA